MMIWALVSIQFSKTSVLTLCPMYIFLASHIPVRHRNITFFICGAHGSKVG
jgi:hypothetical protein